MNYSYAYPRPAVTVDIIIVNKTLKDSLRVLLIERKNEPFKQTWALPGGFVDLDENLLEAAQRELEEETGLHDIKLEQFYTFGDRGRDPRGHTVSIVYYGFYNEVMPKPIAGDDAKSLKWCALNNLPPMAFDHEMIVEKFINLHYSCF